MLVTQPSAEESQKPTFLNGLAAKTQKVLPGHTRKNPSALRLANCTQSALLAQELREYVSFVSPHPLTPSPKLGEGE